MEIFCQERDVVMQQYETMREEKPWQEKLEEVMWKEFPNYIRLSHHLPRYQMRNIYKEYSEVTPEDEKSVWNLYTHGERDTEDLLMKRAVLRRSKKIEEVLSVEEFLQLSGGTPFL